jgi:CDP-diacylglycerol pyrophosphatase
MNSKGVSQVLSLIIAASVLMMMALTLMVALSGSINDFTGGSDRQTCLQGIQQQCNAGADQATVPSACSSVDSSAVASAAGASSYDGDSAVITCG